MRAQDADAPSPLTPQAGPATPHTPPAHFQVLVERAKSLSAGPPRDPRRVELPEGLRNLRYDGYRSIRFRPEKSLWRNESGKFEVQFFHPGFYYQDVVDVFQLAGSGNPAPVAFSTELFSYDGVKAPPKDSELAFTGFRIHTPLNSPNYKDEVIVFQGASYFRPLGKGTVYGLSARGLAVNFAEPTPEEFPRYSEFFLVRPESSDAHVWVLALLESPRTTGAYALRIEPGAPTHIEVTAQLFLREDVPVLGIAPLTSMFLFGEEGPARFGDFRPEVHDSDGLAMVSESGEFLFRPLRNPKRTTVCSFRLDRPRGFGLLQRDREFSSYQDLEAHYQDRPSVWIEPLTGFETGSVRLLEIATELETDDNIAVAFVPDAVPDRKLFLRYRLHVGADKVAPEPLSRVIATRIAKTKLGTRFLVDFVGRSLDGQKGVESVISAQNARIIEQHVERNSFSDGYRASFEIAPDPGKTDVELRAFLKTKGDDVLTETWSYLWQPTGS